MFVLSLSTAPKFGIPGRKHFVLKLKESRGRQLDNYVLNDYSTSSSVTEMLHILIWQALEHRRIQNSLIMLYKIKHQLVYVDHNHLTETRNLKFFVPYSQTKYMYHMNSYFPRTILLELSPLQHQGQYQPLRFQHRPGHHNILKSSSCFKQ